MLIKQLFIISDTIIQHRKSNVQTINLRQRKSSTKFLIAIGFDSKDVEFLDMHDTESGWKVLTK